MDVNQAIINNREILTVIAKHNYTPEGSNLNILELKKAYTELNPKLPIQQSCSACLIDAMKWLFNYAEREKLFDEKEIGTTTHFAPQQSYQEIVKSVVEKLTPSNKKKKH